MISRSILAWMTLSGWEVSPLVELFLVALLFGCGTDFCLFVSWRLGALEFRRPRPRDAGDAGTVVRDALDQRRHGDRRAVADGDDAVQAISSTGPSVAIGLAITLAAALSLTPALDHCGSALPPLVQRFDGTIVEAVGTCRPRGAVRPLVTWLATVLVMAPLAVLGLRSTFVQDVMIEMPRAVTSVKNLRWLATKFETGAMAAVTVVLDSDTDLRSSEGLVLIDDLSGLLSRQQRILEVRSATQPLGSTERPDCARLSERLGMVNAGHSQMESGARQLQMGLNEGAANSARRFGSKSRPEYP